MTEKDPLCDDLLALGVNSHNYRVLALLPLVFVGWADGKIQRAERDKIFEVAQTHQFLQRGGDGLLESWLEEQPTTEYFEKGFRALVELARRQRGIGQDITLKTLKELIDLSLDVAKAAGGLFGQFWSVCPEEELAMTQIAKALSIDDGGAWTELVQDLQS